MAFAAICIMEMDCEGIVLRVLKVVSSIEPWTLSFLPSLLLSQELPATGAPAPAQDLPLYGSLTNSTIEARMEERNKDTFEGMGNERPGYYAADVTFVIAEKRHDLFRREGDGACNRNSSSKSSDWLHPSHPFIGWGEYEIIHPGYQRIIRGQVMPNTKEQGSRGKLKESRICFHHSGSDTSKNVLY
ncbi:mitochondrial protein import protein MAS5-like [Durio zibethinus]|uniref:Mitochondrial protein import protein MAS5-like n=1 Tax=Durio zibethinus TaxID=66656 RepID=A0A6P6B5K7_DURZI|nr:mitochondrial protein import protein MAS5-like [Durio zibethinus]